MYERYERLLNARGKKTSEVCKATGISPSTISHWKKGDYEPKKGVIQKIADYLEFPVDYFYTSSPEMFDVEQRYSRPIYEVSAGQGRINDVVSSIADMAVKDVMDDLNSQTVVIVGDSMLPTLHDGDMVKVVPAADTTPTDYTIVKVNGDESTCKHVEVTAEGVWLRGENKDVYTDRFYTVQECLTLPVQIIGKAVEIVSRKL